MFLTVLTLREALSDTFKREHSWADSGSLSPLSCCKVVVKEETQVLLFSSYMFCKLQPCAPPQTHTVPIREAMLTLLAVFFVWFVLNAGCCCATFGVCMCKFTVFAGSNSVICLIK